MGCHVELVEWLPCIHRQCVAHGLNSGLGRIAVNVPHVAEVNSELPNTMHILRSKP